MKFCALLLFSTLVLSAADYTTYVGDDAPVQIKAITIDAAGNTYVAALRGSLVYPYNIAPSSLIVKVDPTGAIVFSTVVNESVYGIAADASGNIYLVGTADANLRLVNPLQSQPAGNFTGGFLMKFDAKGNVLFSTYLGGMFGPSWLNAVAVDAKGDIYVTGATNANDYQHTAGLPHGLAGFGVGPISAAFFAKISSSGDKLVYAGGVSVTGRACTGGNACADSEVPNAGVAVAVDTSGNAYIAGNAYGTGLPATPGALNTTGIGAFVMKVNAAGGGLVYLTLLASANYIPCTGGSNPGTGATAIAVDAAGNAYIAGWTKDPAFPATASAYQPAFSSLQQINAVCGPPPDAFVAKLNATGSAMVWASFLGGTDIDGAQNIAVDSGGNVWASGITSSTDFPVSTGVANGQEFLVEFNSSGSALTFAERRPGNTVAAALAIDAAGVLHVAGGTGIVATLTPAQSQSPHILGIANAAGGALTGRLTSGEIISIYGLHFGVPATSGTFDASGSLPTSLAGVQVMVHGEPAWLMYVSDTQINAIVPLVGMFVPAQLQLSLNGTALPEFRAFADPASPQIFHISTGSVVNQDGTLNSMTNPAKPGSYVAIWASGAGRGGGQKATAPSTFFYLPDFAVVSSSGSLYTSYVGAAPGLPEAVTQVNLQIPPQVSHSFDVAISVDGIVSDPVEVYVAP